MEVPLDVVFKYYNRCVNAAARLPYQQKLEWLQQHGIEECQVWVEKHRASDSKPLGEVIDETLDVRAHLWEPPIASSSRPPAPQLAIGNGKGLAKAKAGGQRAVSAKNRGQFCRVGNEGAAANHAPRGCCMPAVPS